MSNFGINTEAEYAINTISQLEEACIVGASSFATHFGVYGHERRFCLCALIFERI